MRQVSSIIDNAGLTGQSTTYRIVAMSGTPLIDLGPINGDHGYRLGVEVGTGHCVQWTPSRWFRWSRLLDVVRWRIR